MIAGLLREPLLETAAKRAIETEPITEPITEQINGQQGQG
jgi:hypothetical protein